MGNPCPVFLPWAVLSAVVAALVSCAGQATRPPATSSRPAANTTPDRRPAETARAEVRLTAAADPAAGFVVATITAQAAERIAAIEMRAAAGTATMEIESRPPFGLLGQRAGACSDRRVPIELAVEEVEVFDHPQGGLVVIVVVRATNQGAQGTDMFTSLELEDRRGREFRYQLVDEAFQLYALRQKYGGREIHVYLQPGLSARQVWAYVVPSDVQGLRLAPGRGYRCR